ncbi:hypothetical protein BDC45DRAFT_578855 [Circinella umbellata]|nr:hypothetical protein BDC45DRAFT_578855 [Circinella umbellata]
MRVPLISSLVLVLLGSSSILVSANCNPSYTIDDPAACVKECKISAGRALWSEWTDDPASPNFIESLSYKCQRGDPVYTAFMTQSGTCMMNCSESENSDYGNREHPDSCKWYEEHKNDTCDSSSSDNASPSPSDSSDNGGGASPSGDANQSEQSQSSNNDNNKTDQEQSQEEKDKESAGIKLQLGTLVAVLTITASSAALL